MKYFLEAENDETVERFKKRFESRGYEVADEYSKDCILVSFGGDGSILYNSWNYDEPTILSVVTENSEGNRCEVGIDEVLDAVEAVEKGDYDLENYQQLVAVSEDGKELEGDFRALGEINLHHSSPVEAAIFNISIEDEKTGTEFEVEKAIGDGVIISTSFGSTGYYYAISRKSFDKGIGVAFNNIHKPEVERYIEVSENAIIEIEIPDSLNPEHSSRSIIARDNDKDYYVPESGEKIRVEMSEYEVSLVRLG